MSELVAIDEQIDAQKEIITIHKNMGLHESEIEMDEAILSSLIRLHAEREARIKAEEKVLRVLRREFGQICSYCGWESGVDGGQWEDLQAHIRQCEKHPLVKAEAALARVLDELHLNKMNFTQLLTLRSNVQHALEKMVAGDKFKSVTSTPAADKGAEHERAEMPNEPEIVKQDRIDNVNGTFRDTRLKYIDSIKSYANAIRMELNSERAARVKAEESRDIAKRGELLMLRNAADWKEECVKADAALARVLESLAKHFEGLDWAYLTMNEIADEIRNFAADKGAKHE